MTDKMTRDEVMAEMDGVIEALEIDMRYEQAQGVKKAIAAVSALFDEVEAQQRWIAHLCAFIGPGAMPGLLFSFEAGLPAGGAGQRIKGVA